jgi:hypothetical protein
MCYTVFSCYFKKKEKKMDIMSRLKELAYWVQHNPNRPMPFLVRLVGKGRKRIDGLYYDQTKDILGFGRTLVEAAENALGHIGFTTGGPEKDPLDPVFERPKATGK